MPTEHDAIDEIDDSEPPLSPEEQAELDELRADGVLLQTAKRRPLDDNHFRSVPADWRIENGTLLI